MLLTLLAAALVFFSGVLVGQSSNDNDTKDINVVGLQSRWEDAAPWRHHRRQKNHPLGNADDFDDDSFFEAQETSSAGIESTATFANLQVDQSTLAHHNIR